MEDTTEEFVAKEVCFPVTCSLQITPNCKKDYFLSRRGKARALVRNNGKIFCLHCSRHLLHTGATNPNNRYDLRVDLFKSLTKEAAYLLGWIASDGSIRKQSISIQIRDYDIRILESLLRIAFGDRKPLISHQKRNMISICFNSKEMVKDVCRLLNIPPGKKSHTVSFPVLSNIELSWAFLRGLFDGDGSVNKTKDGYPSANIAFCSVKMRQGIVDFCSINGIKSYLLAESVGWGGRQCLKFFDKLYENLYEYPYLERKYETYINRAVYWQPSMVGGRGHYMRTLNTCKIVATRKDAVLPSKAHPTDAGFDLTLLECLKEYTIPNFDDNNTTVKFQLYDTGIKIAPSKGFYFDLVARSSLHKQGYMLANNLGIIDSNYRGNILVALYKLDPNGVDLVLPFRAAQLVPRPIIDVNMKIVEEFSKEIEETDRGIGGFGSTDVSNG